MKRKIKVRDMTKEQWDDFLYSKCLLNCDTCPFANSRCQTSECKGSWFNNKDLFSDKFLNQEVEIEIPDILDEVEKRYLRAVIKPFRDRVISIRKNFDVFKDAYSIFIYIKSTMEIGKLESIGLPFFKNNMYMGMEHTTNYTLEELDL